MRRDSQAVRERAAGGANRLMRGMSREVQHRDSEDDQEQAENAGQGVIARRRLSTYWQPRCHRKSCRPVALRPLLSRGVP